MQRHPHTIYYTGDFGRSIYDVYPSYEAATVAKREFISRLLAYGLRQVAKTVDIGA
jgi:hypothetical protein